jgi:protein involved in polysaccharide export with SLBB domain
MLEGMGEDEAAGKAIAELGDAATLADKFRRAERGPRRRMIINIAMITLACGVAVGGAVGLKQLTQPPSVSGNATRTQVAYAPPEVAEKTITLGADATVDRLAQELAKAAGKQAFVDWGALSAMEVKKETPIGVPMAGVSVETALVLANERLGDGRAERLACRVTGDMLEVSTLRHFDKREMTLMAYDASPLLGSIPGPKDRAETAADLQRLITSVVDPMEWRENGGETAQLHLVGTKLFVHAPARFQPTVQWILAQVGTSKGTAVGDAGERAPVAGAVAVGTGLGGKTTTPAPDAPRARKTVSITGAVATPGVFLIPESGLSVRQAIVTAGGKFDGVEDVLVSRTENGAVKARHRLSGDQLRESGSEDPALQDGDVVDVRAVKAAAAVAQNHDVVYVTGSVQRPGPYSLPESGITVRRLLIAAGKDLSTVQEVTIRDSTEGTSNVIGRLTGDEIRADPAKDPSLSRGQMVDVK